MFFVITVIMHIVYNSDIHVIDVKKETYADSIREASQVAAAYIIDTSDINNLYDGVNRDAEDLPIDFDALDRFRSTLNTLLDSKRGGGLGNVTNINIPLVGFVTYDYIVGVTYGGAFDTATLESLGYTYEDYVNGSNSLRAEIDSKLMDIRGDYLLPMSYTLYMTGAPSYNNRTWRFTLGDSVYIPNGAGAEVYDTSTGKINETRYVMDGNKLYKVDAEGNKIETGSIDMSSYLSQYGFKSMEMLADYVVMNTVNRYLSAYSGVGFSKVAGNVGSSIEFNLDMVKYSKDMAEYSDNSGVIDGPGLFAIIDVFTGTSSESVLYERIASFGGSELKLRD